MQDPSEKDLADTWGPANAVTPFQIRAMFRMAGLSEKDVYFDLGSGHGRTVRIAAAEFKVKRAVGIEQLPERFCQARALAKQHLTKRQLASVDFWLQSMDESTPTGVTVAYYGLDREGHEAGFFKKFFGKRRVRIILKDLPVLGYAPVAISRQSRTTWFFLMSYPLTKHVVMSRDEWAKSILGPSATICDVYKYYDRQLKSRDIIDRKASVNLLKRLVSKTFKK
jgi:hypothetical protein